MLKYKYAYLKNGKSELILSKNIESFSPAYEDEIEIIELSNDKLIGEFVYMECNGVTGIVEKEEIANEEDLIQKKTFFTRKPYLAVKEGWVRLKKRIPVEIDLRNYRIIKLK